MGCCGEKVAGALPEPKPAARPKSRTSKVISIVSGNWNAVLMQLKEVPEAKSDHYTGRLAICRKCEFHTWLTWAEFYRYINDNGGLMKFIKDIASLETWPLLPKQDYASGRKLFCRVCKCFLMAKAACDDEMCPREKWNNLNAKETS